MADLVARGEDPGGPDVRALLKAHQALSLKHTPSEYAYILDETRLAADDVCFFGIRRDRQLVGIGALRRLDHAHAEIKSMHVVEHASGNGIGRAMLDHLLEVARARGYRQVSLETGSQPVFAPARALYASVGFEPCEPFRDEYRNSPISFCMTTELDRPGQSRCPDPTPRLRFRHYRRSDAIAVEAMFADPLARRFYPDADAGWCRRWIEWNFRNYDDHGFGLWVIEERTSGDFVGDCGLTYQQADGDQLLEIGYHVITSQRGYGYATEAAIACRAFAIDVLKADQVCSIVDPDNEASLAVAHRIHATQGTCTDTKGRRQILFTTPLTSAD